MKYYYIIDGTTYGPETKKQIDERKLAGQIPEDIELFQDPSSTQSPETAPHFSKIHPIDQIFYLILIASGIIALIAYVASNEELGSAIFLLAGASVFFWWVCGVTAEYKRLDVPCYKILGAFTWVLGLIIVLAIPQREQR